MPGKKKTPAGRKTRAADGNERQSQRRAQAAATAGKGRSGSAARSASIEARKGAQPDVGRQTQMTPPSKTPGGPHDDAAQELRHFGLSYPEAHTKSPWPGHLDLAVRNKTFAYLSVDGEPLSLGCKLPHSCQAALSLPFARPTPYGLGKSGWVTATFDESEVPPVEFLKAWIDESYRAIAPKMLAKKLPAA